MVCRKSRCKIYAPEADVKQQLVKLVFNAGVQALKSSELNTLYQKYFCLIHFLETFVIYFKTLVFKLKKKFGIFILRVIEQFPKKTLPKISKLKFGIIELLKMALILL